MSLVSDITSQILAAGHARAEGQRMSGEIWGQTLANIGQTIGSLPAQIQQKKIQDQELKLRTQEMQIKQSQADALKRAEIGQQRASEIVAGLPRNDDGTYDTGTLMQKLSTQNVPMDSVERLVKSVDGINGVITSFNKTKRDHSADIANIVLNGHKSGEPVTAESVQLGLAAAHDAGLASKEDVQRFTQMLAGGADPRTIVEAVRDNGSQYKDLRKPISVPAGGKVTTQAALDAAGGTIDNPRAVTPTPASLAMQAAGNDPNKALDLLNADKVSDNKRADTAQADTAAYRRDMVRIATLNAQANMMRAQRGPAGAKPRNVTSGDANRIAEITTGLNDLGQLEDKIGKTGAGSQIGAALPNFVTEYTGLGADSKSRQAVIDTIKQIIGKSLEGGVLRKEDEIKYEKILPRIGDAPSVAASKIAGLKQTLTQKRGDLLSALDDAGYDTTRFVAREGQAAPKYRYNPATGKREPY